MNGPDGREFPWGKIVNTHTLGDDIEIVEYKTKLRARTTSDPKGVWSEESSYHTFVKLEGKWEDTCEGFRTLDAAVVGALATKYRKMHSGAAYFACVVLGIPVD